MSAIRADGVGGALTAPLTNTDTVMESDGLADLPAVVSPDIARLFLYRRNPQGRVTHKETVYVVEHAADADTAVIQRGEDGTSARSWVVGDRWDHSITASDLDDLITEADTVSAIGVLDARRFGMLGDGTKDNSSAMHTLLTEGVPELSAGWADLGNPNTGAVRVILPSYGGTAVYRFDSPVPHPGGAIIQADTIQGARISVPDPDVHYAFEVNNTVSRPVGFQNLTLHRCGIRLVGSIRTRLDIDRCMIHSPTAWGVLMEDGAAQHGVIFWRILRSAFVDGALGHIYVGSRSDNQGYIGGKTTFAGCRGADLVIRCPGVEVEGARFDSHHQDAAELPFIHLNPQADHPITGAAGSVGGIDIGGCSFGRDDMVNINPKRPAPREAIVLGPLSGPPVNAINGVDVHHCEFEGTKDEHAGPNSGRHAIRVTQRVVNLHIKDSVLNNISGALIRDDWTGADPHRGCTFAASNDIHPRHDSRIYSGRGWGWTIDRKTVKPSARTQGTQLLRATGAVTGAMWTKELCDVVHDVTGPDGVADSAARVTRTGPGSAFIWQGVDAADVPDDQPLVWACWLRTLGVGQGGVLVVRARLTAGDVLHPRETVLALTEQWQQFWMPPVMPAPGQNHRWWLYLNGNESSAESGELHMFAPALYSGAHEPMPVLTEISTAGAANRRPRQWQGLVLGDVNISYGSAIPTSGRHNRGDYRHNISPSEQGSAGSRYVVRGWSCVTAGVPGTWVQDRGLTGN